MTQSSNQQYNKEMEFFPCPITFAHALLSLITSSHPQALASTSLFVWSYDFAFLNVLHKWNHWICPFLCRTLSLSTMLSRLLYAVACNSTCFNFIPEWYSIVWVYHNLLIHLHIRHQNLGSLYLVIINKDFIKICVQVLVWIYTYIFILGNYLGVSHLLSSCFTM